MGGDLAVQCVAYVANICINNFVPWPMGHWGAYMILPFLAVTFQLAIERKVWCLCFYSSR